MKPRTALHILIGVMLAVAIIFIASSLIAGSGSGLTQMIEAQRSKNREAGLPEDQGVEQYTQFEMQQDPMGSIAGSSMRRQANRVAKEKGFEAESNLGELEEHQKTQDKLPIDKMKEDVSKQADNIKDLADQFEAKLKGMVPVGELLARMEKVGDELKAELESYKFGNHGTYGN